MPTIDVIGSYQQTFTTGAVTTIAAGTATAGHVLALRWATAAPTHARIRAIDVEFILTTAFTAAQEVGWDAYIARTYTAAHTGATALTIATNDGKMRTASNTSSLTGRIADTGALTAGTHTLDANAILRESMWCGAIGARHQDRHFFTENAYGGIILAQNEGIVVRNTILMGATGVGKWHFTVEWDDVIVG